MLARTWLSIVNLAVLAGVLAVWFAHPAFAEYAIYACLGWFVVAFGLMYSSWGSRPVGTPAGAVARPPPAAPTNPLATAAAAGTTAPPLDFCIYCATSLPVGIDRCPACGHANARG